MTEEHGTKHYSIFQIAINLAIACFISGAIIAVTYYFTAPITRQNTENTKTEMMQELVADSDKFVPVEGKTDWFIANKNGAAIAYVVPEDTKGYGGTIKMLVAISPEGQEIDYQILSANETPGLGDSIAKDEFKKQFHGKTAAAMVVTKDPANTENIQAITGATISSRAVTAGVKAAETAVMEYLEAQK